MGYRINEKGTENPINHKPKFSFSIEKSKI